jgi:MFS transporter, SP family, arabinose:H+ symporter
MTNALERGSTWYVVASTMTAALGGILFGFDTAVISGAEGMVKTQFHFSSLMEGWFVSSTIVGCILGVLIAGVLSDRYGRKKILLLSAALFFFSALFWAASNAAWMLITFRILCGCGIGVASILAPMYISEISPPQWRGRMVALYQLAIALGIVVAYFSNLALHHLSLELDPAKTTALLYWFSGDQVWRGMFAVAALPALIFGAMILFIPESPRWLMKNGREDRAMEILSRVGGMSVARNEVQSIRESLGVESGSLRELLAPGWRLALIIGILLAILQQFCGINVVLYYGPKIFQMAGYSEAAALAKQVYVGLVNAVFTIIAIMLVDRIGRRPLLMLGVVGAAFSLFMAGLMFHLHVKPDEKVDPANLWKIFSFLLLYCAFFSFSYGPVVWIIISEIFPNRIRGRAMAISTLALWAACWLVTQITPYLLEKITAAGTFWVFAALCLPTLPLTLLLVPETKGRSLEEIEKYWLAKGAKHVA